MNKILAIAVVFVKSMARSRLFLALTLVLPSACLCLPFIVKSDGTVVGWARVAVFYNLGTTAVILFIVALWAACGAISQEINEKQIQLVICKPVTAYHVWFGKWTGMLFLNAVMLIMAGSITAIMLDYNLRSSALSPKPGDDPFREVLTGRRLIAPRPPAIEEEAETRLQQIMTDTNFNSDASIGEIYAEIRKRLLAEKCIVAPGQTREWILDLPCYSGIPCPDNDSDLPAAELRLRFSPAARDEKPIQCALKVTVDGKDLFQTNMSPYLESAVTVPLPNRMLITRRPVTVLFKNTELSSSRTVVFDTDRSLELLVRESSFGANLIRGLIIIFCQLALVSALGLAAGSMLSFPVASFIATAVLLIGFISNFFLTADANNRAPTDHHGNAIEQTTLDRIAAVVSRKLQLIYEPAMKHTPVTTLSEGLLVTWRTTGEALLVMFIIYPALLGFLAGTVLRKRQLALPE